MVRHSAWLNPMLRFTSDYAFGSYTHSGESAQMIFDTMQHVYKMDMVDLGTLNLKEHVVATDEGARACQDYGKAIGQKFS